MKGRWSRTWWSGCRWSGGAKWQGYRKICRRKESVSGSSCSLLGLFEVQRFVRSQVAGQEMLVESCQDVGGMMIWRICGDIGRSEWKRCGVRKKRWRFAPRGQGCAYRSQEENILKELHRTRLSVQWKRKLAWVPKHLNGRRGNC
jgi:hypothetical protein